jgi:hypothetical protein
MESSEPTNLDYPEHFLSMAEISFRLLCLGQPKHILHIVSETLGAAVTLPENLKYWNLVESFYSLTHFILGHFTILGLHDIFILFVECLSALHQSIGLLHDFHGSQGEWSNDSVHL